jgi:hypothetical protein
MPLQRPNRISKEQWDTAAASYELGERHAVQIARDLGVSPPTVSREFARRGCVKGSRIAETIGAIETRLDAEAIQRERAKAEAAARQREVISRFVDQIFEAMDAARNAGRSLGECPDIQRISQELEFGLR